MLNRTVKLSLCIAHAAIFAALFLKRWCDWLLSVFWRYAIAAASLLGLTNSPATQQRPTRRGKQPKPPRTLAVVLADSNSSATPLRQLALLLSWCVNRDIATLFVYHPQGLNYAQQQQLSALLTECDGGRAAVQAGFGAMDDSGGGSQLHRTRPVKGDSHVSSCVHLINADDARWPLVRAAQAAETKQDSATDANSHRAAALHSQLAQAAGPATAVEPDIVLVCGKAMTLAGFPPWLLRYAELYHLGDLRDVTDKRLSRTMQKYSSVSQRFGA